MNDRVARLRRLSLDTKPYISTERAEIMTAFYKSPECAAAPSVPVRRGLALKALMEKKGIYIGEDELIVGERGHAPKATPTYPELCCHSLEDLDILASRDKIPFAVDERARHVYRDEIIPFWRGQAMRDRIFAAMTEEWKAAYEAGVFTEFMEQRAPGHTVLDDKIYRKGLLDFIADIDQALAALDYFGDPEAYVREQELKGMRLAAEAVITFARRHAEKAREMAAKLASGGAASGPEAGGAAPGRDTPSVAHSDPARRRAELELIARTCDWVPAHAPRDFREALQAYWFVHLGVVTELNTWDSFNPGHLDQHLYPFYARDLARGALTRDEARELLQCFWIKFNNQPAPPKVGVTAAESGTYTDFANINLGGLRPDGSDGVNELTYLILEVIDEMRLLQPSSNIQVSKKSPDLFVRKACEIIRKGWGQPSVFNADEVVEELLRQGKSVEDARAGGTSGCVETGAFGKEAYILTGYFNLPKMLELALHNGVDPRTGRRLGPKTGDPAAFGAFDDLLAAVEAQLRYFIDVKIRGNNVIERLYAAHMPAPFLSVLIDDCIRKGRDYNDGGPRYNTDYIQGVGLGTMTDSLSAMRHHVFGGGGRSRNDGGARGGGVNEPASCSDGVVRLRGAAPVDASATTGLAGVVPGIPADTPATLSLARLIAALDSDFAGDEVTRQLLLNHTPRYGNDDDRADDIMVWVFNAFHRAVDGRPHTKGGVYRINLLPTTCHVYFGSVVGATPDGRHAGLPLSEGISPVQGADRRGPTAVLRSAAKMDHVRTGGTLLNQKFTPRILDGERGLDALVNLIRTYFRLDGHHIQFNVVGADTLRAAQANPEAYRDLIVRVAGYSDYFCDLSRALQDEIIARTEHAGF